MFHITEGVAVVNVVRLFAWGYRGEEAILPSSMQYADGATFNGYRKYFLQASSLLV
jgi:hypothetical protein